MGFSDDFQFLPIHNEFLSRDRLILDLHVYAIVGTNKNKKLSFRTTEVKLETSRHFDVYMLYEKSPLNSAFQHGKNPSHFLHNYTLLILYHRGQHIH